MSEFDALLDALAQRIADRVLARLAPPSVSSDGASLVGPRDVGVSPRTWRAAIHRGNLPGVRVGRSLLARRSDVDRWLASRVVAAQTPPVTVSERSDVGAPDDEIDRLLVGGRLRILPGGATR